jgi:hypothetical protein
MFKGEKQNKQSAFLVKADCIICLSVFQIN